MSDANRLDLQLPSNKFHHTLFSVSIKDNLFKLKHQCTRVCVCVCVCERERERERENDKENGRVRPEVNLFKFNKGMHCTAWVNQNRN